MLYHRNLPNLQADDRQRVLNVTVIIISMYNDSYKHNPFFKYPSFLYKQPEEILKIEESTL